MVLAPVFYYNDENAKISSMKKETSGTKFLILLMIRGTFGDKNEHFQYLWNLEHIGIRDSPYEIDDERAIEIFNKSIKFENNRYYVTWPWKDRNPNLPSNFTLSLGRLKTLMKTFIRN